ncbi:DMBT1 [Branchiostoma lanceolatum]|uniref:DMBT1 protein n=1 Tax=Branchiostoma lanceolatum TaxID=7740 RepID=A0A8S4MLT3_BRALA|nr:DMBT1 [Branchiostoma lanceolatum]
MEASFPRPDDNSVQPADVQLAASTCRAEENSTHIYIRARLGDCGTLCEYTVSLECHLMWNQTLSLDFRPNLMSVFESAIEGRADFRISMELFETDGFRNPVTDYPVFVQTREVGPEYPVFVEVLQVGPEYPVFVELRQVGPEYPVFVELLQVGTEYPVFVEFTAGPEYPVFVELLQVGPEYPVFVELRQVGPEYPVFVELLQVGPEYPVFVELLQVRKYPVFVELLQVGPEYPVFVELRQVGPEYPVFVEVLQVGPEYPVFVELLQVGPEYPVFVELLQVGTEYPVFVELRQVGPEYPVFVELLQVGPEYPVFVELRQVGPEYPVFVELLQVGPEYPVFVELLQVGPEYPVFVELLQVGPEYPVFVELLQVGPEYPVFVELLQVGPEYPVFVELLQVGPEYPVFVELLQVGPEYPVFVELRQMIHVQIKLESSDENCKLKLFARTCVATPSNDPDDTTQVDVIVEGCPKLRTLVTFPSPDPYKVRFGFQAFAFTSGAPEVYLHCHVQLCKASDPDYRCTQGCQSPSDRRRREAEGQPDVYRFVQGPIVFADDQTDLQARVPTPTSNSQDLVTASSILGACAVLAAAMFVVGLLYKARREGGKAGYRVVVNAE